VSKTIGSTALNDFPIPPLDQNAINITPDESMAQATGALLRLIEPLSTIHHVNGPQRKGIHSSRQLDRLLIQTLEIFPTVLLNFGWAWRNA